LLMSHIRQARGGANLVLNVGPLSVLVLIMDTQIQAGNDPSVRALLSGSSVLSNHFVLDAGLESPHPCPAARSGQSLMLRDMPQRSELVEEFS